MHQCLCQRYFHSLALRKTGCTSVGQLFDVELFYHLFDSLLLLATGKTVKSGEVSHLLTYRQTLVKTEFVGKYAQITAGINGVLIRIDTFNFSFTGIGLQ